MVGLHSADPGYGEPTPTQQQLLAGDSYKWVAHDCELNNVGPGGTVGPKWLLVAAEAEEQRRSKIARLTATGGRRGHRLFQHRTASQGKSTNGCVLLPLHGGSPSGSQRHHQVFLPRPLTRARQPVLSPPEAERRATENTSPERAPQPAFLVSPTKRKKIRRR